MTSPAPELGQVNGQAAEPMAATIPVKMPNGRTWDVPGWMAAELLERFMANEQPAWVRQRTAMETGAEVPRPGRPPGK